jgi:hypothetical protein
VPTQVTLYAGPSTDGGLTFYPSDDTIAVRFELADGYRVGEGFTGVRMVFGPPGTMGMSIDEAITRRILWPAPPDPVA